jgi:hypothetical protein
VQIHGSETEPVARDEAGHPAVRVLPAELVPDALEATGAARTRARPPRVVRPERLEHLGDVIRTLRAGEPVVVQFDSLEEADRQRAVDMATGIAWALQARMTRLERSGEGVCITPPTASVSIEPPKVEAASAAATTAGTPEPATQRSVARSRHDPELCVLCDLRPVSARFDSPLEMVLRRDGSRDWAPRVGVCERCRQSVRHWRFAVAWCSECERWGRRGVVSPCGLVYGAT